MPTRTTEGKGRKVKVGTILNEQVFKKLKERSAKEGRPIGSVIEDALLKYEQGENLGGELRLHALNQLFSIRFNISDEEWDAIMEEDFYDQ